VGAKGVVLHHIFSVCDVKTASETICEFMDGCAVLIYS
jgi:hypothetical protein